jgi:hypothetical protein
MGSSVKGIGQCDSIPVPLDVHLWISSLSGLIGEKYGELAAVGGRSKLSRFKVGKAVRQTGSSNLASARRSFGRFVKT